MNARAYFLLAPALAALACGIQNLSSVEPAALCSNPDPQPACVYSATCDLVNMDGRMSADLSLVQYVFAPIQYDNQQLSDADQSAGRVNNRDAAIEEFRIHYTGLAVPDGLVKQSIVIPAAGSQTVGVHLIPPDTAILMASALATRPGFTEVIAEVRARGHYTDGTKFETGAFKIPVSLCLGCYGTLTCPAGQFLSCCPQYGQTATCACLTP